MDAPTVAQIETAWQHGYEAGWKGHLRLPATYWRHYLTEKAWLEGYDEGMSERADEP